MIFDTDLLIWVEHKHQGAVTLIDDCLERYVSLQTYMEFLQGAKSQIVLQSFKIFLNDLNFQVLPLTENIGHRASIYIEEYALSSGIRTGDALIAATAVEHGMTLVTGNQKHFKPIQELNLHVFRP